MTGLSTSTDTNRRTDPAGLHRLWKRELGTYPGVGVRAFYLSIVVAVTILFYYQYYVISAVGDQVIKNTGMSFHYFVDVNVLSALASSLASAFGGLTDRYGRANLVVVGVLGCALTCLLGLSSAHSAVAVLIMYSVLGALEGVVLVATSALVRDFSPQVGRATAMGFWTLGPVVGSLITSLVVTNTFRAGSHWQTQYTIAGWIGVGVFLLALLGLRELTPELRDQLLVTERDRALLETRAQGVDVQAAVRHPLRQMLRLDIIGPALGISLFLFIYYAAVGFFPIFFQTVFGYSTARANHLGNWMWGFETATLLLVGLLSDRLRVRKPFMIIGGIGAIVMTALLITHVSQPKTSFTTWVIILAVLAFFVGLAFAPWMAAFTETVERQNPALTATGLSVWGLIVRLVLTVSTFILPYMVSSVTPLIDHGPQVQALATRYAAQLSTAAKLTSATEAALAAHPNAASAQVPALSEISGQSLAVVGRVVALDNRYGAQLSTAQALDTTTQLALLSDAGSTSGLSAAIPEIEKKFGVSRAEAVTRLDALVKVPTSVLTYMSANAQPVLVASNKLMALSRVPARDLIYLQTYGTTVQKAAKDSPSQWKRYFGIGLIGEAIFLPLVFLMAGFWRPSRAKEEYERHQQRAGEELSALEHAET